MVTRSVRKDGLFVVGRWHGAKWDLKPSLSDDGEHMLKHTRARPSALSGVHHASPASFIRRRPWTDEDDG
ncbi:unnamed protein product [Haemonchus placei]|uniref:Oxidoreductase n=1 Tax=Haemonchus placei TaxID=6290 RepID=A0A0N4WXU9_HAEPC|nr:unnamed protein product [Haemonchus placei]